MWTEVQDDELDVDVQAPLLPSSKDYSASNLLAEKIYHRQFIFPFMMCLFGIDCWISYAAWTGLSLHECSVLRTYLTVALSTAALNGICLFLYGALLEVQMARGEAPAPFCEPSAGRNRLRRAIRWVEGALVLLYVVQVGIGVVGGWWLGPSGLLTRPPSSQSVSIASCRTVAPAAHSAFVNVTLLSNLPLVAFLVVAFAWLGKKAAAVSLDDRFAAGEAGKKRKSFWGLF